MWRQHRVRIDNQTDLDHLFAALKTTAAIDSVEENSNGLSVLLKLAMNLLNEVA